ncbi:hypothetical protein [Naasia sp. SYSU D00948]|nr:hypothetical protein [Naasia sp. SYSU D00948]
MSTASHDSPDPACPNCGVQLERGGDSDHRYWSCRKCNLIFLA